MTSSQYAAALKRLIESMREIDAEVLSPSEHGYELAGFFAALGIMGVSRAEQIELRKTAKRAAKLPTSYSEVCDGCSDFGPIVSSSTGPFMDLCQACYVRLVAADVD